MILESGMRRAILHRNRIVLSAVIISLCCLTIILISTDELPDASLGNRSSLDVGKNVVKGDEISKFGEMMVEMLPEDIAFTIFLPSEYAFYRDLKLLTNSSLASKKKKNTYAVISRILAFSTVPDRILSSDVLSGGKAVTVDSISGLQLYISKDRDGMLVANTIRAEQMDISIGKIVLHVMNGVIMDAEFRRSALDFAGEDTP